MQKTIVVLGIFAILFSATPTFVSADWLIDRSGALVIVDGSVLGDDTVQSEDGTGRYSPTTGNVADEKKLMELRAREQNKQKLSTQTETDKKRFEQSRETLKKQIETRKNTQEKTGQTSEFDIKNADGMLRVKQEVKDKNGRVIRKNDTEIKDDTLHIEQADGRNVEIRSEDDKIKLLRNRVRTESNLDLKVGEKNEISVTLPNGNTREVKLPDIALEKLVQNGVITTTEGSEDAYILTAGPNNTPIYAGVEGEVEKKILGFKIKFKQKLDIAAGDSEDGSVQAGDIVSSVSQETSPWRRFLESLAR